MKAKEYVAENGEYVIPVSWEVYSTIRVKGAKNLEEAIKYAKENIDVIPIGSGEYIDDSYKIEVNDDDEAISAQHYADISDVVISVN